MFMFYAGIDIAKNKHEASVIDADGRALLDSLSFSNTKEGCEKLLALFDQLGIAKGNVLIGMEATGHYWLSVHAFFLELGLHQGH
jgi:transposase